MRKSRILLLGLCFFLTSCATTQQEINPGTETMPSTLNPIADTSATAETYGINETTTYSRPDNTEPSDAADAMEGQNTFSGVDPTEATQPSVSTQMKEKQEDSTKQTEPKESEMPTIAPLPTEPATSAPQSTTSSVTEPPTTELSVTEPPTNVPPETTTPAMEPTVAEELSQLDCQEAMNIGNTHGAASYGWTVDPSLNESNAGFHFGSWVFLQEGQARLNREAINQVDFLYREMRRLYPDLDLSGIRFRVHAFACSDGTYEVRVYYA